MLMLTAFQDIWRLRRLLDQTTLYRRSILVGPDINGVRKCRLGGTCRALAYLTKVVQA